jgi:hypothetical protein
MAERLFGAADIGSIAGVAEPAIYFTAQNILGSDRAGQTAEGAPVWRIQSQVEAQVASGLAIGEGGVALAVGGEGSVQTALSLAFAKHLVSYRRQRIAEAAGPAIVSGVVRETEAGIVRIPHLMAHTLLGEPEDMSVWEYMPKERAEIWNGGPLPDQQFFEDHLPGLLQLRADARAGSPMASQIEDHLQAGGYVSMRFVYRHADLFRSLLTT